MADNNRALTAPQRDGLQAVWKERFEKNMRRHEGLAWTAVWARIEKDPAKLWSLQEMERTGGEPDVVGYDQATQAYVFVDCAPESPTGRRNLCYDQAALMSRKENKPGSSAMEMAALMGIEMLTEAQYRALQALGAFDTRTSSWVVTPDGIRTRGGALFCDRRYDHVFVYHNGAESYYAARGFRGMLRV